MGYVNVARAQQLMAQEDLDGLLVVSPENFEYFSGVSGFPVTMWRRAGPASAFLTATGKAAFVVPETIEAAVQRANPQAQILSHPLWIESIDVSGLQGTVEEQVALATSGRWHLRPETYDQIAVEAQLQAAMHDLGLAGKRIGLELDFIPAADMDRLRSLFRHTTFINSSPLICELRLIKTAAEIELLRRGVALTEQGILGALQGIDEGTIAQEIQTRYCEVCFATARQQRIHGFQSARTTVHLGPALWALTDPLRPAQYGDLIQFDSGVQIAGYQTDMGRTFTFGPATEAQRHIQAALLAGFQAGLAQLKPGQRFCDVFAAVQQAVRAAGFPSYARGHVGHSIGSAIDGEEWPWLSPVETRLLEPGMVLAFEVPYYINGIGGFQNENDILITEDGYKSFNTLPLELVSVSDEYQLSNQRR